MRYTQHGDAPPAYSDALSTDLLDPQYCAVGEPPDVERVAKSGDYLCRALFRDRRLVEATLLSKEVTMERARVPNGKEACR